METIKVYKLDLAVPKEDARQITIKDKATIGSDPSADVVIQNHNLSPIHLSFQRQNQVLTLTMLGEDRSTKIGSQKLLQGKMYLLEKGDKLAIGKVKMVIREEEVEATEEEESQAPLELQDAQELQEDDGETQEAEEVEGGQESDGGEEIEEGEEGEETDGITGTGAGFLDDEEDKAKGKTQILDSIKGKLRKHRSQSHKFHALKGDAGEERDAKDGPKKSRRGSRARVIPPGAFARCFGLGIEIFLALFLSPLAFEFVLGEDWDGQIHRLQLWGASAISELWPTLPLKTLLPQEVATHLKSLEHLASSNATSLCAALIFFICARFLAALVLTAPLPLFFMGVTHRGGNFLGKRLIALVRELLGLITFPWLVFDLPLIFKRRSFKEVVTASRLGYSHPLLGLGGGVVLNPLLVAAVLLFPLNFDVNKVPLSVEFSSSVRGPASSQRSPRSVAHTVYQWKHQFKVPASSNRIELPLVKRQGPKWSFDLLLIDAKGKNELSLRRGNSLDYGKKIRRWGRLDPFLAWHSPQISAWSFGQKKMAWSPLHSHEWTEIVEASLRFSLTELSGLALSKGPVVHPYILLRKELFELLELGENVPQTMASFRFGAHPAFFITGETSVKVLVLRELHFETWMAKHRRGKEDLSLLTLRKFFRFAKPLRGPAAFRPERVKAWNGFAALDALALMQKRDGLPEPVVSGLLNFFIRSAHWALSLDERVQKRMVQAFKGYDRFLLSLSKKKKNASGLKNLRLALNRTQKALQKKELQYFKMNSSK